METSRIKMMTQTLITLFFGLAASLCWGSGDFCGGFAARQSKATSVVTAGYTVGFLLLLLLALLWHEPFPSPVDLLWGGLAGVVGAIGLITFYSALSIGRMGIVAPISAALAATIPVLFSIFVQGLPGMLQLGGFALALLAIVLISRPERTKEGPQGIWLALLAGCCFGTFFVLISRVNQAETFWPLAVARFTSVLYLLLMTGIRRGPVLPARKMFPFAVAAGVLDALGNAFFLLAAHHGRLDIASILSSLYPAATVLLAALLLRERVTRLQAAGILLALIAIPMISA